MFLPVFVRGYDDNFLRLTPCKYSAFLIIGIVSLFVKKFFFKIFLDFDFLFQNKCGPRFFIPKAFIPGLYEYKVHVKHLEDHIIDEGCPICLFKLNESPLHDPEEEENRKNC